MHKIEVINKNPDQVSVGGNTKVLIDGVEMTGVKSFKYEIDASSVGVVTIEYYADVSINSNVPDIAAEGILLGTTQYQDMGSLRTKWKEN